MKFKSFLNIPSILALALIVCAVFAGVKNDGESAGVAMASIGLFGLAPRKMDANPDDNGGGAAFQKKVLDGIGEVKKQVATIESNFAALDKESKAQAEDLSKQVKSFEGLPNQVAEITRTMAKIELKVANERRSNFGSAIHRISGNDELRNLACAIIREAGSNGGRKTMPISEDQRKALDGFREYQKALTTGSTPGSGYVNAELITEIYALIAEYGIWRNFDVIPVSSNSTKLIVDTSDPDMLFVDEGAEPGEGSYAGGNVVATIKKILGWIGVTNEMLMDSQVDVARYLLPKFANATARRIDWACTNADGTADATDGGHTGIFHGGTAAVAASGNVSVETLDFEDFLKTMLAVNPAVLSKQAFWWMHPQILIRTLSVKDLNGRPMFLPSIDAPSVGAIGSILGAPVQLTHAAPTANTASSKIAVFGDPEGEAVCLREDFNFAASEEAKFLEDKTVFRARARVAAKVKLATAFGVLTTAAS